MYFHVVYGGARRRYGGAGRNSPFSAYAAQILGLNTSHPKTHQAQSIYVSKREKMKLHHFLQSHLKNILTLFILKVFANNSLNY